MTQCRSLQFFSDKYDFLLALVTSPDKEVKALRVEAEEPRSTVTDHGQSLLRLQEDLNDPKQCGSKTILEIHGRPHSPG